MTNAAHGVFKKISELISDFETNKYGECENENILDCGLATMFELLHFLMITEIGGNRKEVGLPFIWW